MTISKDNFDEIYVDWFGRLCRFAAGFVYTSEDAENIVQSVFMSIWEKHIPVTIQSAISSYLYTLVKNRCIDYLRHLKVKKEYRDEYRQKMESLEQIGEMFASEVDMERTFKSVIDTLPEKCRNVFMLSRVEGKKYREIAELLSISEKTVENQIAIALKKIREELVVLGL
ncbi:MAG: RNA polymerase sigma-70 factor [Bacteroidales bacterium]|nr:RNA polymerase sigma-70 factor [Bacteroidales bacterium]MDD4669466.1 RNA polymerase sigma-70 factor [Bacteroidales bacterium]